MNADAYPHGDARQVSELEGTHERQDVQRHAADIHRVPVAISLRKPGGHHVGITDRLHLREDGRQDHICGLCCLSISLSIQFHTRQYLVYIVVVDDAVKALVDVVEHVHNFHRCAVLAQSGETHYVAEIYCHFLVQLWLYHTGLLQAFHHRATQRETEETG